MNPSETVAYRPNIVAGLDGTTKLRWPHNFGAYRLSDRDMAHGSTLGSPRVQISIKASGAIENVYCVEAGKSLLGAFLLRHWDETAGMKLDPIGGHFFLYPEHQEHRYMLASGVYVFEDVFVDSEGSQAYYVVEFTNDSEEEQRIATYAFCSLVTTVEDEVTVRYDERLHAFVATGKKHPEHARIVAASRKPASYEVSIDHAKAVTASAPGKLANSTKTPGGLPCGVQHFSTHLGPGESARIVFTLGVSAQGEEAALSSLREAPGADKALERTQRHYHDVLERSVVMTPNPEINRGVLWAKANMERVFLQTPGGWGFTNDPMRSTHSVARDAAWFCAGADFFRSDFARECLLQFVKRQEASGMIVEYYDLLSDETEDFGLNVNDDTPLLVWSLWHHYQLTGEREFLDAVYPAALKAGRYLAEQRNEQGLIWCTSRETGSKGIIGWRNVIQGYRLSGATTEVNSQAYGAFRAVAHMAAVIGDSDAREEFTELAQALKRAIGEHLRNPANGLYYLNIDVDGTPRSDVTADLVFPLIFGVADEDAATQVVRRLSDRDFWTPGGMRTIPHDAINYTPEKASGCLGGVWNGMTFWYAKAAAEYIPDFSEEALTNGFENYARNPQRNDTVPGQFSEWLHGQTLVNQGMLLSPWFPPRYIWAVIEGVLGLNIAGDRARLEPNLPSTWTWYAVRNMPYRGNSATWFLARLPEAHVYSTFDFETDLPLEVLPQDLSDRFQSSGDAVRSAALGDGERIVAIVGNTEDRTITTAMRLKDAGRRYTLRVFESLQRRWSEARAIDGRELEGGMSLRLEPKGFHVIELREG